MSSNEKKSPDTVTVIDLCDSEPEEKELGPVRKRLKNSYQQTKVKREKTKSEPGTVTLDDDEIEVVEKAPEVAFQPAETNDADNDDDVQMVGFVGDRLPHMRCHCPDNKFVKDLMPCPHLVASAFTTRLKQGIEQNKNSCELCYCYICDTPASECENWTPKEGTDCSTSNAHCLAADNGQHKGAWKRLRDQKKNPTNSAGFSSGVFSSTYESSFDPASSFGSYSPPPPPLPGPFAPDYDGDTTRLDKCGKCGWYSKLTKDADCHAIASCSDWCHACGCVLRFPLKPTHPFYKKLIIDVSIGTKEIPFTIKAHDPRKLDAYKDRWTEQDWEFDEAAMEADAFRQRFGACVMAHHIVASVPTTDKVPENARFLPESMGDDHGRGIRERHWSRQTGDLMTPGIRESEGVILDNKEHLSIFRSLTHFADFGLPSNKILHSAPLVGHIRARWDKQTRKGTFFIDAFLRPNCSRSGQVDGHLTKLLGLWFGAAPFPIASLGRSLEAREHIESVRYGKLGIPVPPFGITQEQSESVLEDMKDEISEAMLAYQLERDECLAKDSLVSSTGKKSFGGRCRSEPGDFQACLKAYYTEMLPENIIDSHDLDSSFTWIAKHFGMVSDHRNCAKAGHGATMLLSSKTRRQANKNSLYSYIPVSETPFAMQNLLQSSHDVFSGAKSLESMLRHIENVGHKPIVHVEGLTVELLPYQKESVQWALEREQTAGGLESFLWTKLPLAGGEDLYLNPILDKVRKGRPPLVRGGLICEEMGLGKTIISLAVILENPAPSMPPSGSEVPDKFDDLEGGRVGWDPDLKTALEVATGNPTKRGSILSHGTLVVCHVSLVGQWVEEAKNRLKNPGLVYSYHGQSRKRNPKLLAENAIVVTTYATLSSDANFHAKQHAKGKKNTDEYVPPCEQVRWWRVICDESHTMRSANTQQSRAVEKLVADHRWGVTGTPINTSIVDLHNQLKLVGLNDLAEYFAIFRRTVMFHVGDRSANNGKRRRQRFDYGQNNQHKFGQFVFFMRQVMIRHSKNMKYRGTDTDLMQLPSMSERTIEIELSDEEREDYTELEDAAKNFYLAFKAVARKELSKYFLKLSSALKQQRCACSGGQVPLIENEVDDDMNENDDEQDEERKGKQDEEKEDKQDEENDGEEDSDLEEEPKARKKRSVVKYRDFVYRSKAKVLIDELIKIRDSEPESKSLVFSNFASSLKYIGQALKENGFDFRSINGQMPMKKRAEALAKFQNDPPTTIFLLSMRSSNCGINLTQANRVFFLEPSLNPASEAQAIGRVVRLGQTREVEVVRLVVKNSLETRLVKMLEEKYGSKEQSSADNDATDKESEKNTDDDDETCDGDKKPKAVERKKPVASPTALAVGSLTSDKTKVLTREFDLLFGVEPDVEEEEDDDEEMSPAQAAEALPALPQGAAAPEDAQSGCI